MRTCCGCIAMRKGVLILTGIQAVIGFLGMWLSIADLSLDFKSKLKSDFSLQDPNAALASAIIFGMQGLWVFFGFFSALKRIAGWLKLYATIALLSVMANVAYAHNVKQGFHVAPVVVFFI